MNYENIIFQLEKGIGIITMNRPKALNALNGALLAEMSHVLDRIASDETIAVLIITGAGEKAFVAGADITELASLNALEGKLFADVGQAVMDRLQDLSIPVIAAVNGFALGGGNELAMACDFIYASENAMFGLPETNLGLIPGFGGTQRLPRQVGKSLAKEMIFTAKTLSAEEAERLGIVNKVCPQDRLMEMVMKVAGNIAAKGRVSIRAAKFAVNMGMDVDLKTGCRIEKDAFALCMASEDSKEGTGAFMQKRKADFKGTFKN